MKKIAGSLSIEAPAVFWEGIIHHASGRRFLIFPLSSSRGRLEYQENVEVDGEL